MSIHERKASLREFYGELTYRSFILPRYLPCFYVSSWSLIQEWYSPLCCNFTMGSLMLRRGSRGSCVTLSTREEMRRSRGNCPRLKSRGRKNVGFAWRWTQRLSCLVAVILCAFSATETGKASIFVRFVNSVMRFYSKNKTNCVTLHAQARQISVMSVLSG